MTNNAIEIKNISKKYNITHQQGGYVALRDVIMNVLKNPFKHAKNKAKEVIGMETKEEFWALKDINLTIKKGEIVGIIGANGAGKSTLLKLLSQITPPTTGEIKINGRIASLLEVGTGFHPELTGRENIFLNGAILGMTKKEITERFDNIVEFSGVKQFIDTPVKRYSSGMYVRLAFAVAAHMEPDILVVDEVLAVGDAEFQKKSLGKLDEVSKTNGRTILFVSHNMAAIQRLCLKTILLEKGKMKMFWETDKVIDFYIKKSISQPETFKASKEAQKKDMFIADIKTTDMKKNYKSNFIHKDDINIYIICQINKIVRNSFVEFSIIDKIGRKVFTSKQALNPKKELEKINLMAKIPGHFLTPGNYFINIALSIPGVLLIDLIENVCNFTITDSGSEYAIYNGLDYGCVFSPCKWVTETS